MLTTRAQQAAKATIAKQYLFPDRADVAIVADVESRSPAGSRGCFQVTSEGMRKACELAALLG